MPKPSAPPPDFRALFRREPEFASRAHGRVNLIGEHTDYNGGLVLPTPVPQCTGVELARRDDDRVTVWSAGFCAPGDPATYALAQERAGRGWLDYVQGVTWVLRALGHRPGGVDVRVVSTVPPGAGLASSAALEVALLRAFRDAFDLSIDDVTLARAAQRAEREFVGAPVGIMDQMVASLGQLGEALQIDTRTLQVEPVALPAGGAIVVIDSGVTHGHAAGEYRARRAECERAASLAGVGRLCDLSVGDLSRIATLPFPLDRRARHVVTDSARVLETVAALKVGDLTRVGQLFSASHASMRDDFEISTPEVDALVAAAAADDDVYGARLTGGGFGGAIVALARTGRQADVARRVVRICRERLRLEVRTLVPQDPEQGAG